jgi:hypothetical protein
MNTNNIKFSVGGLCSVKALKKIDNITLEMAQTRILKSVLGLTELEDKETLTFTIVTRWKYITELKTG